MPYVMYYVPFLCVFLLGENNGGVMEMTVDSLAIPQDCSRGMQYLVYQKKVLHNIVPTHLFILHINQPAYVLYGKKHVIYLYLENYSTHKHQTNTSM